MYTQGKTISCLLSDHAGRVLKHANPAIESPLQSQIGRSVLTLSYYSVYVLLPFWYLGSFAHFSTLELVTIYRSKRYILPKLPLGSFAQFLSALGGGVPTIALDIPANGPAG